MHRATVRDFEQPPALIVVQFAHQCNMPRDAIDTVLAVDAVLGVHAFVHQPDLYIVERQLAGVGFDGNGGYFQANYRLGRQWIVGSRLDYVDGFGADPEILQFAPNITWWQSEWVRLRLQYNYLRSEGGPGNHTVLFQTVWSIGPHKHETY